jgi:hypothetical protein
VNKFFHTRETVTLIKGAVFLGFVTYFDDEVRNILSAVAELIR